MGADGCVWGSWFPLPWPALAPPQRTRPHSPQCRLRLDDWEWPVKGQLGTMALVLLRSRSSGFVQQLQFLSGQPPGQGRKLLEGPRPNKSLELLLWFLFGLNSWLVVTVELRVTDTARLL